jgi:hypothetical protein
MANQNGTEQVNEQWVMAVQVDEDAAKAFDALRDERAALDPDELVQINADIPTAATIALASFERLRPLRALVAKKLPEHEMKHWDALPSYALAALHAHVVTTVPADRDDRVERLLEEARPLREKLLVAAEAIAHAGVFDPDRVAQVRSGAGNVDRAADLVALCALYTERWAEVENRTMVTKEEVRRAGVLGPALLKAIGARDLASKRSRAELRLERARAFTLLIRAYESCQQAVAYVRFRARDADEYTPSLRPRPRARRPTSQEPRAASPAAAADHRFRSRGRAERRRRCGLQRASARGARAGLVAGSGERAALSLPLEAGRDPASEQQAPSEAGGCGPRIVAEHHRRPDADDEQGRGKDQDRAHDVRRHAHEGILHQSQPREGSHGDQNAGQSACHHEHLSKRTIADLEGTSATKSPALSERRDDAAEAGGASCCPQQHELQIPGTQQQQEHEEQPARQHQREAGGQALIGTGRPREQQAGPDHQRAVGGTQPRNDWRPRPPFQPVQEAIGHHPAADRDQAETHRVPKALQQTQDLVARPHRRWS